MEKVYIYKDTLVLPKPKDVTFTRRRRGAENTMSAYQRKGISTLSPAVSAVISGMLYSSGAVAVIIQPLPNPVGTIAGEYYVSIEEGATPREVNEEEITYNGNLKLFGNIADANAEGAVNGKTFDVSSKFTKNETSLFNVSIPDFLTKND